MKQRVINPFCATPENHYPVNKVCVSLLRVATDGQVGLSRTISLQSVMCVGTASLLPCMFNASAPKTKARTT